MRGLASLSISETPKCAHLSQVAELPHLKFPCSYIPEELRNILQAESALNDGAAYPHVALAVLLLDPHLSKGEAIAR